MNSPRPEPGSAVHRGTGMTPLRIACGILWAVIAVGIGAGGVGEVIIGNIGGAVVCIVIAALSGWYDYRVWTRKARLLILIFVWAGEFPVVPWRRRPNGTRTGLTARRGRWRPDR